MCGICCIFHHESSNIDTRSIYDDLQNGRITHRGPDINKTVKFDLGNRIIGVFSGYTLHFRGVPTPQPIIDSSGNILLWNAEVFGGIGIKQDENDGKIILEMLSKCENKKDILNVFGKIEGPWAAVYWQTTENKLWFGRDVFGRRSLLCHNEGGSLAFSSVAPTCIKPWQEIPALGIYMLKFKSSETCGVDDILDSVTLFPWLQSTDTDFDMSVVDISQDSHTKLFNTTLSNDKTWIKPDIITGKFGVLTSFSSFNEQIPSGIQEVESIPENTEDIDLSKFAISNQDSLANELLEVLGQAVKTRVQCQSNLCDICIKRNLSSARHANANSKFQLPQTTNEQPKKTEHFQNNTTLQEATISPYEGNETNTCYAQTDKECFKTDKPCGHTRVAVLFSGGIDSLVIAALADKCLPEHEQIDLLNVAFAQKVGVKPRTKGASASCDTADFGESVHYDVPDRITGKEGLAQLNPNRKWNFVEINVTLDELQTARSECVQKLVYPLRTVLDDSIGCAIWFASRGVGEIVNESGERVPYTSSARVVLVGMGADEQLVGYSRHRVKYNTGGWEGLVEEIKMEIERISSRNLGRDDRVISDHGKESRFPFLDENVVNFLNKLPIHHKANLNLPRGIGEKFLLRLASTKLGLRKGAVLPKRAIQFGSRIAKMENRKEKASDVCDRLQ